MKLWYFYDNSWYRHLYADVQEEILETLPVLRRRDLETQREWAADMGHDPSELTLRVDDPSEVASKMRVVDGFRYPYPAALLPMVDMDHFIEAKILPQYPILVNENAFAAVMQMVRHPETTKVGRLYGIPSHTAAQHLIPHSLVDAARQYDWTQHTEQLSEWAAKRVNDISKLSAAGAVYVTPSVSAPSGVQ